MPLRAPASVAARWLTFNAVGVVGFVVQMACLWLFVDRFGLHYLLASALALEAAIVHNFVWHARWTWRDRPAGDGHLHRLARFNALHGATAIVNLVCMVALVEFGGMPYLPAAVLSVGICSLLNFFLSHTVVFVAAGAVGVCVALPPAARAAELTPQDSRAFEAYARVTESRLAQERRDSHAFLWVDRLPDDRRRDAYETLRRGELVIARVEPAHDARHIRFRDSLLHHWVATAFVPGADLAETVALMQAYGRYGEIHAPAVRRSRLIAREGNRFQVSMQLYARKGITVVMNADQSVEYIPVGSRRMQVQSRSTRIAEVEDAGTPDEREKAARDAQGFLWRFNNYCALEERAAGTYVQCETLSLSRDVPTGLGWVVGPYVSSVPRESLEHSLVAIREAVSSPRHE